MALYARKACSNCGIMLPQPQMCQRDVTPTDVRGNPLPPRPKWFCGDCAPPSAEEIRWSKFAEALELERQRKAKADQVSYSLKKLKWREEEERRRLAKQRPGPSDT